ncbi:MAG: hypothetical protein O3B68_06815, partial [Planctomycetota bacterium]|nr:hypothetical protein [Planctomycetota bacterium]
MNHIERYSIFAALRCFIAILCRVIKLSDSFGAESLNTKPTRIEPGESCFVNSLRKLKRVWQRILGGGLSF